MKLRPEVVRFLEAQTLLTIVDTRRRSADVEYREADSACRRAWDALTAAESEMVNDACQALEAPESVQS